MSEASVAAKKALWPAINSRRHFAGELAAGAGHAKIHAPEEQCAKVKRRDGNPASARIVLIAFSRTPRWRWLAGAGVAELITTGLVGCLAVGMVCIELHRRALPADAPDRFEVVMLLATLFGFALMWSWFQICGASRFKTDQPHHPDP